MCPTNDVQQRGLPIEGIDPIQPAATFLPITAICAQCGASVDDGDIITSGDGTAFCQPHYDELFTACAGCDEELDRDDVKSDDNGREYHVDCYREVYCECDICGSELNRDSDPVYSPEDGRYDYLCESCFDEKYTRCGDCECEVRSDDTTSVGDSELCDSCFSNNCGTCDECGEHFRNDELCSNDDGVYCDDHYYSTEHDDDNDDDDESCDCSSCRGDRNRAAASASRLPAFSAGTNSYQRTRSQRSFGVELETATCEGHRSLRGQFHFSDKEDGSITGREFVSIPLAGDKGLDAISAFCGAANRDKFTVDNKCGYHAHFGVGDLSDDQLKAVAYAFHATYKVWSKFVSSARRGNSYCGKNSWDYNELRDVTNFYSWARGIERYQWFNVAAYGAHKTFEVRLHSGTLDAYKVNNWVVAILRFIDAMTKLTLEEVRAKFHGKTEQAIFEMIADIWDDSDLTDYYVKRADKFGTTFVAPAASAAV